MTSTFPPDAANVGGALQDGFFIIEWLRRMGEAKDIPIIIISGDKSAKDQEARPGNRRVVGFFPKPIDHVALLATIRATLGEDVGDKPPEPPDRLKDKARLNGTCFVESPGQRYETVQIFDQIPPNLRWRRAYSSSAAKNCGLRKSGQSVGVMTSSA